MFEKGSLVEHETSPYTLLGALGECVHSVGGDVDAGYRLLTALGTVLSLGARLDKTKLNFNLEVLDKFEDENCKNCIKDIK